MRPNLEFNEVLQVLAVHNSLDNRNTNFVKQKEEIMTGFRCENDIFLFSFALNVKNTYTCTPNFTIHIRSKKVNAYITRTTLLYFYYCFPGYGGKKY